MKKFLLAVVVCFVVLASFSQGSTLPCVQSYKTGNAGGGVCPTIGSGNNAHYPGYLTFVPPAPGYINSGKIKIFFKTPIPVGISAPAIMEAGPENPGLPGTIVTGEAFDYKYYPSN